MDEIDKSQSHPVLSIVSKYGSKTIRQQEINVLLEALKEIQTIKDKPRPHDVSQSGWYAARLGECVAKASMALLKYEKMKK